MPTLSQLHADIDARVKYIRDDHPDWLCGKGCDGCCQRLAQIPLLSSAEWELLQEGLAALSSEQLEDISQKMLALTTQQTRPFTCPMLDRDTGACQVYVHRPVACRTYGFYVQRDKGLYCHDIETQVAAGNLSNVIWGNHDAIDRELAGLGKIRPLTEWFSAWRKYLPSSSA